MAIDYINLHMAQQLLKLQNTSGFHSSVSTVWNGDLILIVWNHVSNSILQIWPEDVVEQEDLGRLHDMVKENLVGIM